MEFEGDYSFTDDIDFGLASSFGGDIILPPYEKPMHHYEAKKAEQMISSEFSEIISDKLCFKFAETEDVHICI
jgi:hypothetical protein